MVGRRHHRRASRRSRPRHLNIGDVGHRRIESQMLLVIFVVGGIILLITGDMAAAFVGGFVAGILAGLVGAMLDSAERSAQSQRAAIRREANDRRQPASAEWRRARTAALQRDRHQCVQCGRAAEEVDHIRPRAMGGDVYALSNLQSMCKPCHKRKTARQAGEIRRYMRGE